MSKNRAFTMVELLAVLVVLGIIMAITIPTISYFIRRNDKDYYLNLEKLVASSGQDYFNDFKSELPKEIGHVKKVPIEKITDQKHVTEVLGTDKEKCVGDIVVQKIATGEYTYTSCLKCEKNGEIYNYESNSPECNLSESNNSSYIISIDGFRDDEDTKRIPQGEPFTIPMGEVFINGQNIGQKVKPTPSTIDTNLLGNFSFFILLELNLEH